MPSPAVVRPIRRLLWSSRGRWSALTATLGALALVCAVGCEEGGRAPGASGAPEGVSSGPASASSAPASTATGSGARFVPLGPRDGAPTGLVVEFGEPVHRDDERMQLEDFGLTVQPPVRFWVRFVTPSAAEVIFQQPLAPGVPHRFTLSGVKGDLAQLKPAQPWTFALTPPPFRLVSVRLNHAAPGRGQVDLRLLFSARPNEADVRKHLAITVGGEPLEPEQVSGSWSGNEVTVSLASPRLVAGAELVVRLADGVRPADDASGAATALAGVPAERLTLGPAQPVRVIGVTLTEGADGQALVVRCDDPAAGPPEDHWLPENGNRIAASPHCLPDAAAALDHIVLDPPTPYVLKRDRAGFRLVGDFARGPLKLTLTAGLPTQDGGRLGAPFSHTFTVPGRARSVRVATQGRYLPRGAWQALPVSLVNVPHVRLRIHRVPPTNLGGFLARYGEDPTDHLADEVVDVVLSDLGGAPDQAHTAWIDLNRHLPDPAPGIYSVALSAVDHAGTDGADGEDAEDDYGADRSDRAQDARRVVISDLQLVAKAGSHADGERRTWRVFALDAHTLRPVAGVDVDLVRASGTALARCRTAGDAGCTLDASTDETPVALVARRGQDFTYLDIDRLQTRYEDAATHGKPYRDEAPYTLAPFADRGVWRPGETVRLGVVVRDEDLEAPTAGLPVVAELFDPREQRVRQVSARTDGAGLVTYDLAVPERGLTGTWEVNFSVAGTELASLRLPIEDIVPERMAVTVKPVVAYIGPDAPAAFSVRARYLFGGGAEGSEVTAQCRLEPGRPAPPGAPADHVFGVVAEVGQDLGELTAKLGPDGATLTCPVPATAPAGEVHLAAAVQEAGSGRVTRGTARITRHITPLAVGLKPPTEPARAGVPVTISGVVLGWDGAPAKAAQVGTVAVQVERLEPTYGWHHDAQGHEQWDRHLRAHPLWQGEATLDAQGRFTTTFTPEADAEAFRVNARVGASSGRMDVPGAAPAFAWRDADDWEYADATRTPGPARASNAPVTAPPQVEVGKPAEATFEAPFAGVALLTLETDRVESARWVPVKAGTNRWSFKVARFTPNVYLSALVLKDPHLESKSAWLPDRAVGTASVRVVPAGRVLTPTLTVPETMRPGEVLEVQVDAGGPAREGVVVVAAVDEGILQLTRHQSPDPNRDLLARRALAVSTYETIGWGLRLASRDRAAATGGGDDGEGGGQLGERPVVAPVALWSGPVRLDAQGRATVQLPVPRFRGKLRVMAVVADATRAGAATAAVVVRDPLTLTTTAPLFARRGDRVELPVFVTNLTDQATEVKITARGEAGLSLTGVGGAPVAEGSAIVRTVALAQGASHTEVFGARITGHAGQARLAVRAEGAGLVSEDEARVDLRPEGPTERHTARLALVLPADGRAAPTLDLSAHLDAGFLPGTDRLGVRLAADEAEDALDHLRSLARYPHGCLEQTTSQARPLLALGDLFDDLAPGVTSTLSPARRLGQQASLGVDSLVASAIERVLAMQTAEGGFAYWSGGTEPHLWGTTQAVLFLLDAQAAGHTVAPERLASAVAWLARLTDPHADGLDRAGSRTNVEAWIHYTLARAGRAEKARIAQRLDDLAVAPPGGSTDESRTLLRAALYLAGDRRHAEALKAPAVTPLADVRSLDFDFWSDLRGQALEAAIFVELFGADPAGQGRIDALAAHLRRPGVASYTTSELAWSLHAVARWRRARSAALPAVALNAGDAAVPPARAGGHAFWIDRPREAGPLRLAARPGAAPGTAWAVLTHEGVRPAAQAWRGAEGLQVTRHLLDAAGAPLDASRVRLGQLVFVRLTLHNQRAESVPNVALVDALPAGFAVENARLVGDEGLPKGITLPYPAWAAEHLDLRDDRMAAFGNLAGGATVNLLYTARAVVAGTWQAPGAEAEAMYDPRLRGRDAPGTVTVIAPWTERM